MTETNDRKADDSEYLEQVGTEGGMVLWEELCQEYPDQDGDTILHLAVLQAVKHLRDIVQLLRLQGQINFRNRLFQTPLHLAALTSQYAAVQPLLDLEASLSAQDCHGNTPLHTACQRNDCDMLRALLVMQMRFVGGGGDLTDRNDDVRLRDGNGDRRTTAQKSIAHPRGRKDDYRRTGGSYDRQLKTRNDIRESDGAGVFSGDRTYHLRKERVVDDADNGNGDACGDRREDKLTALCMQPSAACTKELTEPGSHGGVGEGWRAERRREEEVAVVLSTRNYEGLTCLHIAVQNGALDMVQLLLERGADVNAKDGKSGRSALHFAVENNQPSTHAILLLLLQHPHLLINDATFSHQTALQLARGRQRFDLVDLLHQHAADWSDDVCDWSSDSLSDGDMEDDSHVPYDDLCVAGQPLAYTGWR